MDMWAPYRDAVWKVFGREMVIVVDKFHVVQMIKKAFEEARKETEAQLRRQAKQAGIAEAKKLNEELKAIRRSRGKFLMSDRLLALVKDGSEEMRQTLEEHLILADTRGATRDLFRIYRMRTPSEAAKYYEIWKKSFDPKLWKYFGGVFSSFEEWGREILNYWDYRRATNAYTESANGRLKWRRRLGAGYEFETYRAFALYSVSRPRSARHESPKTRQKRLARRKAQLRRDIATEALTEETYAQRCQSKLMRPRPADGLQYVLEL
jgi:transposase